MRHTAERIAMATADPAPRRRDRNHATDADPRLWNDPVTTPKDGGV